MSAAIYHYVHIWWRLISKLSHEFWMLLSVLKFLNYHFSNPTTLGPITSGVCVFSMTSLSTQDLARSTTKATLLNRWSTTLPAHSQRSAKQPHTVLESWDNLVDQVSHPCALQPCQDWSRSSRLQTLVMPPTSTRRRTRFLPRPRSWSGTAVQ